MCINPLRPEELINKRKAISDQVNNTDLETFPNSELKSSKGEAYKAVREKEDDIYIQSLERMSVEGYYEDLFKRSES